MSTATDKAKTQKKKSKPRRKKAQTRQPNKKRTHVPVKVIEEYFNPLSFKRTPITDVGLQQIGQDLIQWTLNDPDAITMREFFFKRGIGSETVARWCKKSPNFKKAYELALEIVGTTREKGAIRKQFDGGFILNAIPRYLPEYKDIAEWRATLKDQEARQPTHITVQMPQFPSSDIVPHQQTGEPNETTNLPPKTNKKTPH